MTSPENSSVISKIKRSSEILSIHNLLVINRSGICIYGISFTDVFRLEQEQLISSYFTALMSFTKELIGDKIKTLEMGGGVKLIILEKGTLYYALLCDVHENPIILERIISRVNVKFMKYVKKNHIKTGIEYIYDDQLDQIIKHIIKEMSSSDYNLEKEDKVIKYLKMIQSNDEISELVFLTDGGKILYSTARNKISLKKVLKEIDFRIKICNNSILKMFYTSKDNELIFSEYFNENYLIILIFDTKTKFGVAEFYLHKIVAKIRELLN
ncbi:MAG: hypothetical protein ACFFFB_14455 [Candidatus Heimdallarchaeota archaeon]